MVHEIHDDDDASIVDLLNSLSPGELIIYGGGKNAVRNLYLPPKCPLDFVFVLF